MLNIVVVDPRAVHSLSATVHPAATASVFFFFFVGIVVQERADPDWANTSIKPFQHTSRRKKALTLGRRKEKFRQRNWGFSPESFFDWCAGKV